MDLTVIYFWPHVDFMALFRLFRGGKFKKPSVICQSFAFAVEEGRPVLRSERYLFTELSNQKKKKKLVLCCTTNIYCLNYHKTDFFLPMVTAVFN